MFNEIGLWLIEEAKKRLDVELVSVMMLDKGKKELYITASSGLPEKIVKRTRQGLGEGISGYVAEKGKPLLVKDIEKDARFTKKSLKKYWTKSLISCPIKDENHLFGILNVNNKKDKTPFNENDLKKVKNLAKKAGDKFLSASMKNLRQRLGELDVLLSYFQNISSFQFLSEVIKHTQDTLALLFQPVIIVIAIFPVKKVFIITKIKGKLEDKIRAFLSKKLDYFFKDSHNIDEFQWAITHFNEVPYPILADQRRIGQVFTNLISNAIQIMDGKGKIGIKIEREGNFVKIEVSDTGPGIPDEIKKKIFEPFFTTRVKGIGLGLSIVKEIVEKHGGHIEVSSSLGKGSSFKVFLPLQ